MSLNTLKQNLLCCVTLLMSPFALAHESAGFALTTVSTDAVLHWLLAHQGLLFLVTVLLAYISVKALLVKRKAMVNSSQC